MTLPRYIPEGGIWAISRHTTRGCPLLHPDANRTSEHLFWYVTAVIAAEVGIQIHAVQVINSRIDEVLSDPYGQLSRFTTERNRTLSSALKKHRKWPEEVFARAAPKYTQLFDAGAVVAQIAETLNSCVETGLAANPSRWPGITTSVNDMGRTVIRVKRPDGFFNAENPRWPDVAEIEITIPQILLDLYKTAKAVRRTLRQAVNAATVVAQRAARAAGHTLRTIAESMRPRLRRMWHDFAHDEKEYSLCRAADKGLERAAGRKYRTFWQAYNAALLRLLGGARDTVFPYGTWRLKVDYRFETEPPGSNSLTSDASQTDSQ